MTMKIHHHHQVSECCGSCGSEERLFLHNVRHRGSYRRLCTPCVLHHHSGSFCPVCFDFYGDHPPPPHQRLMCLHCPSISHLSCVGLPDLPPPPRYQCPPCSDPNYFSFHVGSSSPNKKFRGSGGESAREQAQAPPRAINKHLAMQLMAASRIASASMNKAASIARVEAERRVKEAILARNRAKEALDRVACLVAKQEKEKATPKAKMNSKPMAEHQKQRPKVNDSVVAQKRIQNQIGAAVSGSLKTAAKRRIGDLASHNVREKMVKKQNFSNLKKNYMDNDVR